MGYVQYNMEDAKALEEKIVSLIKDAEESYIEYFNKFGDKNGMDFQYEFIKYHNELDDWIGKFKKIGNRVSNRIELRNKENSENNNINQKPKIVLKKRFS